MAANLLPGVEYDAPNSVLRETTILFHRYNGKHANAEPWQVRVLAGPLLMPDAYTPNFVARPYQRQPSTLKS